MSCSWTKCGNFFFVFSIRIFSMGSLSITSWRIKYLKNDLRHAIFLLMELGSILLSTNETIQDRISWWPDCWMTVPGANEWRKLENWLRSVWYEIIVWGLYLFSNVRYFRKDSSIDHTCPQRVYPNVAKKILLRKTEEGLWKNCILFVNNCRQRTSFDDRQHE